MLPVTMETPNMKSRPLAFHDDAQATIATLLADNHRLRLQLTLAESVLSRGLVRGWRPHFMRK
ncbi:hypothetical protein L2W42_32485 (plasmid) [Rhizobium gallicum]|nr:hypothetical protein [Rhizobium gallicum]ULJ75021.1 hypothetical protein L2W42_32485 [Rhizobium gallicum]